MRKKPSNLKRLLNGGGNTGIVAVAFNGRNMDPQYQAVIASRFALHKSTWWALPPHFFHYFLWRELMI
jgi:hypothetical protein